MHIWWLGKRGELWVALIYQSDSYLSTKTISIVLKDMFKAPEISASL